MTALKAAFQNDPDLVNIDAGILPHIFQTLFVCTGCDYFLSLVRKERLHFYIISFQFATFILLVVKSVKEHLLIQKRNLAIVRHFQNFASETAWLEEICQNHLALHLI